MTFRLAVFTQQIGTVSETFVRRHIEDILPGRTVVVSRWKSHPMDGHWHAPCPVLFLDQQEARLWMRIARRAGMDLARLRDGAVSRFLRAHNVDLVLGEYLDQFVEFVPLLDRLGIPYVVQGHGIDLSAALRKPGTAEKYAAFKSARAVLTRCEFHRRRLIALGLSADKVHVNPGGVDIPSETRVRTADAATRFLAIGRMVTKKGPIFMLEAFRQAAQRNPHITLDYVGHGELWLAVRQFVEASDLVGRVRLHKTASEADKNRLLRECGVFIQHSLTDPETGDEEGLPAAIQEAMAHGMAVISTRHSGIAEAVDHGVTGCLVEEGDTGGMADALVKMASRHDLCVQLGVASYAKAKRLYSWAGERERLLQYLGFELSIDHG